MMIPLLHLGMLIVGVPYSAKEMIHTEARGGSPYGASTIAGPKGELAPTVEDLAICHARASASRKSPKNFAASCGGELRLSSNAVHRRRYGDPCL